VVELLLALVMITDIGALVVATGWFGNCTELELDVSDANAAMLHTNISAAIAAAPRILALLSP